MTARARFDTDALRQWEGLEPPADPAAFAVLWRQLISDLLAAADWIDRLEQEAEAA